MSGLPWSAARPAADSRSLAPWLVQEADDAVAAEVRRVRHRRTPVAVGANQDVLVDQRRIPRDERAHRVDVVAPDRVGELHGVDEPRPARCPIAPREHELRVGQLRGRGVDRFGMELAQLGDRSRVAGVDGAEEFLGLAVKLIEVGPDGQAADGHDEPPSMSPWSAGVGQRRFGYRVRTSVDLVRWTRSCPRTGGVLHARSKLLLKGRAHKKGSEDVCRIPRCLFA